jgi:hypothetical protein
MRAYMKALAAFFIPGAVLLFEAVVDDKHGDLPTGGEWLLALLVCVLTSAGVFTVRNRPQRP